VRDALARAAKAMSRVAVGGLVWLVRLYQATVSPLLGPCCRYAPSCSVYAVEALRAHGLVRGMLLAAWRVLRCPGAPVPSVGRGRLRPRTAGPRTIERVV